jgi:hypothetical protein
MFQGPGVCNMALLPHLWLGPATDPKTGEVVMFNTKYFVDKKKKRRRKERKNGVYL